MFGLFEKKCMNCCEKISGKPIKAHAGRTFCSGGCSDEFGKSYPKGKGGCCG